MLRFRKIHRSLFQKAPSLPVHRSILYTDTPARLQVSKVKTEVGGHEGIAPDKTDAPQKNTVMLGAMLPNIRAVDNKSPVTRLIPVLNNMIVPPLILMS